MNELKKITFVLILFSLLFQIEMNGQHKGNMNHQYHANYSENNIDVGFNTSNEIVLSVKGLSNVDADAYVAIFSVTQIGKTIDEINELVDERIEKVKKKLATYDDVTFYMDMISFIPTYEYKEEIKFFNRRTYNEIPKGFKLQKNLHIKYTQPDFFEKLMPICAEAEIYDLVRVDYYSENLSEKKKEMMEKANVIMEEKLNRYKKLLDVKIDTIDKYITEGFRIIYPAEAYQSYTAYSSSSLNFRWPTDVNVAKKNVTQYYQPVINKEFDFVINPIVIEPTIQVLYEIKLKIIRKVDRPEQSKDYFLITPNGDLRSLNFGR